MNQAFSKIVLMGGQGTCFTNTSRSSRINEFEITELLIG